MPVAAALVAFLLLSPAARGDDPACVVGDPGATVDPAPARGSEEEKADLAIVLWEQRTRTPEEVARAASEVRLGVAAFAAALGAGFDPAAHPLTEALLDRAGRATKACTDMLKKRYARPRPYLVEPRVVPAVQRETSPSYPSGHATRGVVYAAVLSELAPGRREALERRGLLVGTDRVIAGVHWPSDIAAGQRLGALIARALLADPAFRRALEETRAKEWGG